MHSQANKSLNGSPPVCSKYSQTSKNWNGGPLYVVSIIKLVRIYIFVLLKHTKLTAGQSVFTFITACFVLHKILVL